MVEVPVLLGSARGHRQRVKRLGRTSLNIMAGRYEREVATFLKRALRDTRSFLAASRGDRCGLRARARCSPQAGTDPTERPYAPRALRSARTGGWHRTPGEPLGELQPAGRGEPAASGCREGRARRGEVSRLDRPAGQGTAAGGREDRRRRAEIEVLAGMGETLRGRPALVVECHSMVLLADCIRTLKESGYGRLTCSAGGDFLGPPMLFATD
jgi:hypothetical protein